MKDVFDKQTLELTLRASNEGIWEWNVDSEEIYYSFRIKKFMGYGKDTPPNIMTHPELIVHQDSIDYFQDLLSVTLLDTNAEHLSIDCKILRPDGEARWIRIRGIIIRDNNIVRRMAGSMIDISKRKFAEEMVAEERNMLRLIFDNIPLQVYFKDTESYYKLVNQRQVAWLGKSDISEIIGKSGKSFFSTESWQASRKEELQIMQTGIPVIDAIQKETWPNKPDSYVQKVKHPWYDSSGKLLGTYGISCDVTTLIQAKKKLESLAINLQQQNKNYQEELMLATEIQRAILPENSPDWEKTITQWKDRININTLYTPASELAGDFYDVISISEQKIGFLIIDVMGNGVRSAIIISLIRGIMEQAEHLASEPTLYLEALNDGLTTILQKALTTLYASACYTLVDFESNKITIVDAGHDFPLIRFTNSSSHNDVNTSKKGSALGIRSGVQYSEVNYSLSDIKSILLFTDGIYGATNRNKEAWGLNRLKQEFNNAHSADSGSAVKYIFEKATEWIEHGHFTDDVCLLSLEIVN
jgi:phosphoserine phosphatase RsbU/P